jgi:hypothetical protein
MITCPESFTNERLGSSTAGRYVSDSAATTQGKASDTAEAVKDTAARATQTVADTARAAGEKASQAATATKDAAVDVRSFALDTP